MSHIDFTAAFSQEPYKGPRLLYLQSIPSFDGTSRHPDKVAVVRRNIYGTPNSPQIFVDGLSQNLRENGYTACLADKNVYYRRELKDQLVKALTIDDFLVFYTS